MAAQIPIKNDPVANEIALDAVRQDKRREVADGHDGTWVAHPGLVPIAVEEFQRMTGENQVWRSRSDVDVTADQLLSVPLTPLISEQGIRTNVSVGVQYMEAWLRGSGCVPINNLMEDAATAEISRAQLWQWVRHGASTVEGTPITVPLIDELMDQELGKLSGAIGRAAFDAGRFADARRLFQQMTRADEFPEFLTTIAYELL
jgi:malate synthase